MASTDQVVDLSEERRKRLLADPRAVPRNDDEARTWLDALMRGYGDRLARYFVVRVRDEDTARDLVIETFYQAWKSRHTYRGEAKATTWLWTIGRRSLGHHFEKAKRREGEVLTDEVPEVTTTPDPADRSAKRKALSECLGALNERMQRTAELVWLLGHSYVEAAEILDEGADSIRMRLKRARKPLQDCLVSKGIVGAG